jgi:hypothetical protein
MPPRKNPMLNLNCCVIGDDLSRIFYVEVDAAKRVNTIKSAIKKAKPTKFQHLEEDDLEIWMVSIPIDDDFSMISEVPEGSQELTRSWSRIETLFLNVQDDDLHILIGPLPRTCGSLPVVAAFSLSSIKHLLAS